MSELEIEIKAYCPDMNSVKNLLQDLGAEFIKKCVEKDIYFNHPGRDFGETDEALRLRDVSGQTTLTYKGSKLSRNSKARVEEETVVEDFESMKTILINLGFTDSGNVEKKREYFKFDGIEICLDRVKSLGDFVELEIKGVDIESTEKKLYELAEKLGLKKFETRSYLELLYYS